MADTLKDRIGAASIGRLADALVHADPDFPRREYERSATRGIDALELKARIDLVARALAGVLPSDFTAAAALVEAAVPDPRLGVWELWPMTVWIGAAGSAAGTADVDRASRLLALVTPRCTGEFGIRPLINADPPRMLATFVEWAGSADEHVRRLASEGSRPLLPWASRLDGASFDPGWALPVLDLLTDDPSGYVRRSVANHLNDIAKLDPDLAMATAERWRHGEGRRLASILGPGLRTLTRRGERRALALVGLDPDVAVSVESLTVTPRAPRVGGSVEIDIALRCDTARPATVACGYVIEFARSTGRPSRKLFTLGTVALVPGQPLNMRRRYVFRPLSTRAYHPGAHAVEVMVNGRSIGRAEFRLDP